MKMCETGLTDTSHVSTPLWPKISPSNGKVLIGLEVLVAHELFSGPFSAIACVIMPQWAET